LNRKEDMSKLHIWKEDSSKSGDLIRVGATVEDEGGGRRELWYKLPARFEDILSDSMNPYAVGMIFTAMREARDIHVHGSVSKTLLDNLEEFQNAWQNWRPETYRKISIEADEEADDFEHSRSNDAIATFSGGVDGAFSVYRHSQGLCGRMNRNIIAGVFIHGMDIPLEKEDVFDDTAERMRKMLGSLGIDLITISTNHREFGDVFKDSHSIQIVSSMLFLENRFHTGLIASSKPYNDLVLPWGSNPLTDRLLSSGKLSIVHDNLAHTRSEKIVTIAEWDSAMKFLRVCWQEDNRGRNCCRCEKCMRTILDMRSHGIKLPECFEHDVDDSMILGMKGLGPVPLSFYEEVLSNAKDRGMSGSWVQALEKMIRKNRKALKGWRWKLREMQNRHHLRTTLSEKLSKSRDR
jgi:hypothetical protein